MKAVIQDRDAPSRSNVPKVSNVFFCHSLRFGRISTLIFLTASFFFAIFFFLKWQTFYSSRRVDAFRSMNYTQMFKRTPGRHWTMYNKPWKTGSSTRSYQLSSCLIKSGYRVLTFNWTDSEDIINPVTPIIQLSPLEKMFSGNHGRFNLGELQNIKQTGLVDACYVTSVRDPATRVPSHLLQLVDGENVVDKGYNASAAQVSQLVCSTIDELEDQFMVHYMAGMHRTKHLSLSPNQTKIITQEILRTYDIVADETGTILYDNGSSACAETRHCLKLSAVPLNVKIGGKRPSYPCQQRIDKIVQEEAIFYREMKRLMRSGKVV